MEHPRRRLGFGDIGPRLVLNDPAKLLLFPAAGKIWPYTMQKYGALCQLYDAIRQLDAEGITGNLVEMGCWKGGTGAFMAWCASRGRVERTTWLFDSFQGLPDPTAQDIKDNRKAPEKVQKGYLRVGIEDARAALDALGVAAHARIVEGWFNETVPAAKKEIGPIAVLRLDGDMYEPTKYCLEELYDQVVPGGYVVIDDYKNWIGCRRALYEFFAQRDVNPYLEIYPYGGRAFFRKGR